MREESRLLDYLEHILQAVERIQDYTEDLDEVTFLKEEMAQDAVIRNLEVIGEAKDLAVVRSHCLEESHAVKQAAVICGYCCGVCVDDFVV